MPKVSLIVPVYRVEKLLHRCLNSIKMQTYPDWECILVDDGSPDGSGLICDVFSKLDCRFRSFHTDNQGASAARNYGIDKALGDWICFVDSDDWIDELYIEHLMQGVDDCVDMVLTNYASFQHIKKDSVYCSKEILDYMIENNIFAMSGPVAKLYRRDILINESIRFPLGVHMGEDAVFNTQYMYFVNKACFSTRNDYHYDLQPQGSLSCRYYGLDSEYQCFQMWRKAELQLFERFYPHEIALKNVWKVRISSQFKRVYQSIFKTDKEKSLKSCIVNLQKIDTKYLDEFARYGVENNFSGRIQKFLLIHKLYLVLSMLDLFIFRNYINR